MDSWSHEQIMAMLEGGNEQLQDFFMRHKLSEVYIEESTSSSAKITKDNVRLMRYKTKAALFYRQQLNMHIRQVLDAGAYRGRAASRRLRHKELHQRNSAVL